MPSLDGSSPKPTTFLARKAAFVKNTCVKSHNLSKNWPSICCKTGTRPLKCHTRQHTETPGTNQSFPVSDWWEAKATRDEIFASEQRKHLVGSRIQPWFSPNVSIEEVINRTNRVGITYLGSANVKVNVGIKVVQSGCMVTQLGDYRVGQCLIAYLKNFSYVIYSK